MKNIHTTSKYNPECAHTWDNQLDVHIIPCSSQRIEHNLLSSHLQQKSGLIGHPCRGPHLQNLDKPCQRRGNDFLPRKKKKKKTKTDLSWLSGYAEMWRNTASGIVTLKRYEISLHCSSVGSTPVGLWAQGWSKKKEPSGAFYRSHQTE
jgi:hypothetical protein